MSKSSTRTLDKLLDPGDLIDDLARDYSATGILDNQLRSSIAASLVEASGNKDLDSITLRYPYLTTIVPALVGSTLGGLGSYYAADHFLPDVGYPTKKIVSYGGVVLGGVLGQIASSLVRRAKINKVRDYIKNKNLDPSLITIESNPKSLSDNIYNRGKLFTKELISNK